MRTLKEVKCKSTVTVVKLHGEGAVKRRIMDMGHHKRDGSLCPQGGASGGPCEVNVRGYESVLKESGCRDDLKCSRNCFFLKE